MTIRLKTVRPAPTNRYEDRDNWRLVDTKGARELQIGSVVQTSNGERVTITGLQPPHKSSSQGKVSVTATGERRWSQQFYASVVSAEYQYTGEFS